MKLELGKIITEDITELARDPGNAKKREYFFIKKLEMNSVTYPQIKIEQLDLCADGSEEFDVWIKTCVHMTKDELFEFLKAANDRTTSVLYSVDEKLPAKVTIETFPKKEDLISKD